MSFYFRICVSKSDAFTFLEVLVTLSVLALLAFCVLPDLKGVARHGHDEMVLQSLRHALQLSQEAALSHRATVILCPSDAAEHCKGDWSAGWLAFVDQFDDGVLHETSQILFSERLTKTNAHLYWRAFPYYYHDVRFQRAMLAQQMNGTFWYCHAGEEHPVWALILSQSGRVRLANPGKEGTIPDSQGKPLQCG